MSQSNIHGSSAPEHPLRIILVENDPLSAKLIRQLLAARMHGLEITAHLENGYEIVQYGMAHPFAADVILMDMHLGDIDGPIATWRLRRANVLTPVLGMTSLPLSHYAHMLQVGGGQGLCSKRDISGIATKIQSLANGNPCTGFDVPEDAQQRISNQHDFPALLTPTQTLVMELMDKGFSDNDIAERLACTTATIRKHRQYALSRLGAKTTREGMSIWHDFKHMLSLD